LLACWPAAGQTENWYKGNLHAHSNISDGDAPPAFVAAWYKQAGYQFLALPEHNLLAPVTALNSEGFLVWPSEEVTDYFEKLPVHFTAVNVKGAIQPAHGTSLVSTIQNNLDAIQSAGSLAILNHPNARWAMTSADLLKIHGLRFLEVFNGHPMVGTWGGGGRESPEEMWDALLSAGRKVYGVAADDAHEYHEWGRTKSNPGRGWIVVRAARLDAAELAASLERGDFYASTGVELAEVTTGKEYRLRIVEWMGSRYTTYFIGQNGRVLKKVFGLEPRYQLHGSEHYVRARVEGSNGDRAWTQPLFVK
jgi:hypothetical protein